MVGGSHGETVEGEMVPDHLELRKINIINTVISAAPLGERVIHTCMGTGD